VIGHRRSETGDSNPGIIIEGFILIREVRELEQQILTGPGPSKLCLLAMV